MRLQRLMLSALLAMLTFTVGCGCNSRQQTYAPAPPVANVPTPPVNAAPPLGGDAMPAQASQNGAYHWRDVPANENVSVVRATFDQGGYQIYAQSGEIIAVPFENQNLQVLKFGRSQNGTMSFVNENGASPILYVPNGGYLENAAAAGAKWYPLPNDFSYTRPVYVAIAPSWNAWTTMGWYPGMAMYGGMWGYNPGLAFAWMPSFYVNIGGSRYNGWGGYSSYYNSNPGYVRNSVVYRNYNTARPGSSSGFGTGRGMARSSSGSGYRSSGGFGRSSGSSGFGRSSGGFGSSRPSSGSSGFGSGNGRSFGGSGGSFGSGGSGFGSSRPSFGSSGSSGGSSAFGRSSSGSFSGQRSTGSSFGSGRTSGGSFSGSGSSFGSGRSSGSSFGGSSSSGGSFRSSGSSSGGGRSSFGGSSSSGRSSFGGSSGRRR